ncbi:MAG: 50S ribosomal protein L4 [Deltaproteobacteria bacterium]|jgi:large subunit ribosomal protein L4|nr:50S ribosomal protein L4 [Deltaproteobacteria bacterium]
MATLEVVTLENKSAGSVDLNSTVFEAPVRTDLLHAEVRRQLTRRRSGTHSTKNRAAVSGGGSKPWRQKGSGRARQGTTRAPQWSGGGVVFGPVPRSYEHALPKKVRGAALRSALSHRLAEGDITVVDSIELDGFKTRRVVEILRGLSLADVSVLIVIEGVDEHIQRSARNLPGVTVLPAGGLNVLDVLRHQKLLVTKSALDAIESRLARKSQESDS